MKEDFSRRRTIKRWTNWFSFLALVDVFVSFPAFVILLKNQELTQISTLVACMQISCHEFLIFMTAWLMIKCGRHHFDRIDAAGAWMVVHPIVLTGNICLLVFETWPDYRDITKASYLLKSVVGWKIFFIVTEISSTIYCSYIVQRPVAYIDDTPASEDTLACGIENVAMTHTLSGSPQHQQEAVQYHSEDVHQGHGRTYRQQTHAVDSILGNPPPYSINPSFENDTHHHQVRRPPSNAWRVMEVQSQTQYGSTSNM